MAGSNDNDKNADPADAVAVALVAPDAHGATMRAFAASVSAMGARVLPAADMAELRAHETMLTARSVAVLDERHPEADAVRRWLKADPARARVRLMTYNQPKPPGRPDRLWICADCLLEAGIAPENMARAVGREIAKSRLREPRAEYTVRFLFPGTVEFSPLAREWLDELLAATPLPPRDRDLFGVAVMEAVDNIRHASALAHVHMTFTVDGSGVGVEITLEPPPTGKGFRPSPEFSAWREDALQSARRRIKAGRRGGLGLIMLHRFADRVHYDPDRHAVTLWKYPTTAPEEGAAGGHNSRLKNKH